MHAADVCVPPVATGACGFEVDAVDAPRRLAAGAGLTPAARIVCMHALFNCVDEEGGGG